MLLECIELNNYEKISQTGIYKDLKLDINFEFTPAKYGFSQVMLQLASKGIDIFNTSANGLNALHLAAAQNFPDVIMTLISFDFPINETTNQGLTALAIATFKQHHQSLQLKDNIAAKILIDNKAVLFYEDIEKRKASPILLAVKNQLLNILEMINSRAPGLIFQSIFPNNQNPLQYAALNSLDEIVSYLSVISSRIQLDEEDENGMNAFLYYLSRDNYEMCNKLIFRGADVNHVYIRNGGKTPIIMMVQLKNDVAIKFLLDKNANPHICFGADKLDACDLAKQNGLEKRFYIFQKCDGQTKILNDKIYEDKGEFQPPAEIFSKNQQIIDKQTKQTQPNESREKALNQGRPVEKVQTQDEILSQLLQKNQEMNDDIQPLQSEINLASYENSGPSIPRFNYPSDMSREQVLAFEADRLKRQVEFIELEKKRELQLKQNKEQLKVQQRIMLEELQRLDERMIQSHDNYAEVENREMYLFEEKIKNYKLKREQDKNDLILLQQQIQKKQLEREEISKQERLIKLEEEQAFQVLTEKVEQKRQEILGFQEVLQRNVVLQNKKEVEIEDQRKEVFMKYLQMRKKIDYEQVQQEANHLRKEVENDFLEREIQDRIRRAKLQLELQVDQVDTNALKLDNDIQIAKVKRAAPETLNKIQENLTISDWSQEEGLWETYKEKMRQQELAQQQQMNQKMPDFSRIERYLSEHQFDLDVNFGKLNQKEHNKTGQSFGKKSNTNTKSEYKPTKQITIYEEMRLAEEMISQLSSKIKSFGSKKPQSSNRLRQTTDNTKLMSKAFNRNQTQGGKQPRRQNSQSTLISMNQNNRRFQTDAKTVPTSPNRSPMSSHLNRSEINSFIRNHKQIESEKQYERQRSNLRSQKTSPSRPVFR
ncbi:ankyrin repeat-containing protein [Stylonychia lemnae]|uniref:Ankyrin repeat-containing protein n=1 Tax=Stylonychia lemnae TaxID=5949 RepID=A0A077ZZI7_STYLE|nr:ankyrin repeat-containing protein [Stylonychia lemnae]|eukprot:CDW75331.1 ankyrin repeat-containing protein [Stylonychia lemnae]